MEIKVNDIQPSKLLGNIFARARPNRARLMGLIDMITAKHPDSRTEAEWQFLSIRHFAFAIQADGVANDVCEAILRHLEDCLISDFDISQHPPAATLVEAARPFRRDII